MPSQLRPWIGDLLATGDGELHRDQIEPRRLLGDGVLHLDPPVQLEEVEVAAVDQELDRAEAPIADLVRERDRRAAHSLAHLDVDRGRRRLLHHLLMPPLDRAIALAERVDVPVLVREQLDLHMSRTLEVALEEDGLVSECGLGLAARRGDGVGELRGLANASHPPAATACGRLDHQRKPDLVGLAGGEHGNPGRNGGAPRLELVAAAAQRVGSGADEDEPPGLDRVGLAGVQRALVVGGDDGDGRDPFGCAGAKDPGGDLAAVGYEELPDLHAAGRLSRNARKPSCPSGLARSLAASCAASSPPGRSRISCFAARVASGPAARSSPATRSIAASRAGATSWTSPIRRAVSASKRSPVRKKRLAAAVPILGKTNGEITAGTIPSLTSEKPKTASGAATATSVQQTRPEPPPNA